MDAKQNKSAAYFICDYVLYMVVYFVCSGTLLARLTGFFAMPLWLSNVLMSLPSILQITQLLGAYRYNNSPRPWAFLKKWNLLWRLCLPLVYFSVLLVRPVGAAVMVTAYIITVALFQFIAPAHSAWLVDTVEGRVSDNYYSVRELAFMSAYTVAMLASGLLIDATDKSGRDASGAGFLLIGAATAVLVVVNIAILFKKLPPPQVDVPKKRRMPFWSLVKTPLHDKGFAPVLLFNISWNLANMFLSGFGALYQIRVVKIDYLFVVYCTMAANILRAALLPFFAKLARRIGWKRVSQLSLIVVAFANVQYVFLSQQNAYWLLPIILILSQAPIAGFGIGFFKMQIAAAPAQGRSTYFAVNAAVCGIASVVGTLACSVLVGLLERNFGTASLGLIFMVGVAFIVPAVLMIQKAKE
ncbi:MAG: MFS transporter [Ruthenibacterium sp.]